MDDLIAFLRARLDEDEQTAQSGDEWTVNNPRNLVAGPTRDEKAKYHLVAVVVEDNERAHIARHDPARVLAEVEAKRRILRIHNTPAVVSPKLAALGLREGEAPEDDRSCMGCGLDEMDEPITADVNQCPILRALALPYADHPDYQEQWRP